MVEWYQQGKSEVLGGKHYIAWVVDEWMSMEQWWNDTDRGKLKYWEEKSVWVICVHEKSHVIWSSMESNQHNEKVATAWEMAWPVPSPNVNDQVDVTWYIL